LETTEPLVEVPTSETWIVAALFGAGIQVKGTADDAQEMCNKLAAHVQLTFKEAGITFVRKHHIIKRKTTVTNGGSGDINDEIDAAIAEAGEGESSE